MLNCFNIVATTEGRVIYVFQLKIIVKNTTISSKACVKDLFFPISEKVMFRNYRCLTTENILKCYHRVYISMIIWYVIPVTDC